MPRYVTREEGCRLVQERLGLPLKKSRVEKLACKGDGPPVAAKYGQRHLHEPEAFLAWAESLIERSTSSEAA